jgi:biopolymer transport protein ExbD
MRIPDEDEGQPEVQMGPLIDCVFLLLIFFLVVAVSKKTIKELNIKLPDSVSAVEAKPKDENLVIRVTSAGTIFLSSDEMTRQTLRKAIRERALAQPKCKVLLEADARTRMSVLAPILDEIQFSGLKNLAIRTTLSSGGVTVTE